MKTLKHLFTVLILLCCVGMAKAHDFEVGGIYYNILSGVDKTVEVTYRGTHYNEYSNEYTGSVVIPESITYNGTTYSVTSIGEEAFYYCTGLTSITIPNSVTSIGYDAFSGTAWYNNQPDGVVYAGKVLYRYKGTMPSNTSITIKDGTLGITGGAFYECDGLISIIIPNSVTSIGNAAFNGCTSLKELRIEDGEGTLSLGYNGGYEGLFYDCPLEILYLGRTLSYNTDFDYGYSPFYNKTTLTSVTIGNSVTSIGDYAFQYCRGLTSITIPNSVTSIGKVAFDYCTGLTSIEIPNSVTSIGNRAFYECRNLTSVVIGNSVTSIGYEAFYNCSGLTSIEIPNSVTSIGDYAFQYCRGLTSITIPNSVTSIGDEAFYGCKGLKTVFNFSNLTFSKGSSGYGYVAYYADKIINAPNAVIDGDFIWGKLNELNTLAYYLGEVTDLTLPSDYNGENYVIGNYAFYDCSGLTSITIPNSVTSIGYQAFQGCTGLISITIPNSVTSIGENGFAGCCNVETLYIGSSIESIGSMAFAACEKITEIKVALEKPIRVDANIFTDAVYDNATLYIPNGTKSLYEKREPWNLFFYIVEMDYTGIENVKAESGEVQTIYDLTGRKLKGENGKLKGIYIIDGKKVLVK